MRRLAFCAVVVGALLCARPAVATILQGPVDVETLTRGSEVVLRARVVRQESHWGAGGPSSGVIFTTAQLDPLEWLKGEPEAAGVLVRVPGGALEEWSQEVQGVARFRVGEEVVVFLQKQAPAGARAKAREGSGARKGESPPSALTRLPDLAVYTVHLWAMGKFALAQATAGGRVRALRDRQGLLCRGCGADLQDDLPLDELRARVRAAAQAPRPKDAR